MQKFLLILSHRTGRIGLLTGLALGFVISIIGSIIHEVSNLTDTPSQINSVEIAETPALPQVNVGQKRDAAFHVER